MVNNPDRKNGKTSPEPNGSGAANPDEAASSDRKPAPGDASDNALRKNDARELDELERRLTKMAAGQSELVAGRVQLLKFDNLRKKLGNHWERLADRIQLVIQTAVQRRLTKQDISVKYGELGFMIVFAQLDSDQAALKCALIADEVAKNLFGSDVSPDDIEVHSATATVSGGIEMRRVEDIESLLARMAESLDVQSGTASDSTTKKSAGSSPEDETDDAQAAPVFREPPPFQPSDLDYVFQPLWDVPRKVISTFLCLPSSRSSTGNLVFGEAALPDELEPRQFLDLDSTVLRHALLELRRALQDGRRFLVSVPVHFETLGSVQRRQKYLEGCRVISSKEKELLLFDIINLPDGVPQSRLAEISVALKPHCRAILARCSSERIDFAKFKAAGILAIGFDAQSLTITEARLMQRIDRFVEGAEKSGLQTFVYGLNSMSLSVAAIASGVTYVCGHMLTSISEQPENVTRYDLNDLFGLSARE